MNIHLELDKREATILRDSLRNSKSTIESELRELDKGIRTSWNQFSAEKRIKIIDQQTQLKLNRDWLSGLIDKLEISMGRRGEG
jgi:uncharacterized FlaG/YvyC family protein